MEVVSDSAGAKMMAPMTDPAPQQQSVDAPAASVEPRQIAYAYAFGFDVPAPRMEALQAAHRSACEAAGPAVCYIVSSSISGLGQSEYASAVLEIRARPEWVEAFLKGMDEGLEAFGARVDSSSTTSEDLTVQIVDTTAQLNAAKTLRGRLQDLLSDRPGKLSELLEIERELARVQAQIDSTESFLAMMRSRVAMSAVTLTYQPRYSAASESIWMPLGEAVGSFLPAVIESLSGLIRFVASVLPAGLVLLAAAWGALTLRRRRRRKAAEQGPAA
jgi:hypothetical protein